MKSIYYDAIIFSFLVLDILGALIFLYRRGKKKSRRVITALALLIFAWAVVFYGSFIEPRILINHEQAIALGKNPRTSLKVVMMSDLHLGPYKGAAWAEKVVRKIQDRKPDIIFLAGDFIFENVSAIDELEPLKNLRAPLGVYAVLGNHDYDDTAAIHIAKGRVRSRLITKKLENFGINVLINKGKILEWKNSRFILLGTDDVWTGYADIQKAYNSLPENPTLPVILLSHNPDVVLQANEEKDDIDLVLASHTHGGQIRLPFIGSVPRIPTRLGNKYDRGLFDFDGTQLFITSGVSETGPRARLLVPPEIATLDIKL